MHVSGHDPDLIARASSFHPWDAMAPAALAGILRRGPFRYSAETGCGGSTIVLSHASERHVAFAIEGENRTITGLRNRGDLRDGNVIFVEGETRDTLPGYRFEGDLDLALLDGPHAYPLPQLEFAYLFSRIRVGGWLVLDDLQIPSVHELFQFLFPPGPIDRTRPGWLGYAGHQPAHHLALLLARPATPPAR